MANPQPPYEAPVPTRYAETAFEDLPGAYQNRVLKYENRDEGPRANVLSDRADRIRSGEETPQVEKPHVQKTTTPTPPPEQSAGDDLDESGDPMPDAEFPHHKGGGYYVLSDGRIVRGQDKAESEQAKLD